MADYYAILKKTISALPVNSAQSRQMVYGKARAAIEKQLRNLNPAPPEQVIERHLGQLSAAIDQIEAEHAAPAPSAPEPAVKTAPAPVPPAPRPAPVSAPPAPPPATEAPRPAAPRQPGPPAAGPKPVPAAPRPPRPTLAGDAPPPGAAPAYDASLDALEDVDRPVAVKPQPAARPRAAAKPAQQRRGSGMVVLLVSLALAVALIGGGAYAVWRNKDAVMATLGLGQPEQPPAETAEQAPEPAAEDPVDSGATVKEEVRLNPDGETVEPPPAEEQAAVEPVTPLPVEEPAAVDDNPQVSPVDEAPAGEVPATDLPGATEEAVAETPAAAAEEAAPAAVSPALGQKAYLYEEGIGGAGATRDNAAIAWSLDSLAPSDGAPPEAVIRGRLEVPGRGLTMDLTIKRNTDEALPASHIIELLFTALPDFSGGNVDTVARFVMKSSEQARGEGLVAVPAKIDTGYFLIALNNLEQAMETNQRLLLESSWIDIPLGYTTGRRALVTLEKGSTGEQVFKDAFADWKNR